MTMFMIHTNLNGKSIPLLWGLDENTRMRLGHDVAMLYSFPNRDEADLVMAEVPALHEMDAYVAKTLHIVEYKLIQEYPHGS